MGTLDEDGFALLNSLTPVDSCDSIYLNLREINAHHILHHGQCALIRVRKIRNAHPK